ncbi:hypothetical protein EST38_g11374 [Candolleomyces aberdarensis]|uniref:Uncharacterized protein n=1 Tax=Candolleomyces aberdarensis TaxID=2316362 RepID=A0A4Q2D5N5_9AGAR|nr:hypothetical protein EST38_g11374 [Candolleomyces aberdarensis]
MAITVVEDRDPIFVYQGAWNPSGNRFESNGTTMVTSEWGASITIEFVGRNVSVFGTVPVLQAGQQPTKVTFSLDDAAALPATTFTAQHHPNATQYYIPMFRSPALTEDKKHKLVVTHISDRGGSVYFDYMTIQGSLERFAVPETGLNGTAKVALVGGVLGGVILILLGLVGALLWKSRRAQRAQHYHDGKAMSPSPSTFMPFNQSPMNTGSQTGNISSDMHARSLQSPVTTMKTGYTSVQSPYRPPLPEMHES